MKALKLEPQTGRYLQKAWVGSWEGSARAARFVDHGKKTAPTLGLKGHRHEDAVHQNELIRAQLSGTNGEC